MKLLCKNKARPCLGRRAGLGCDWPIPGTKGLGFSDWPGLTLEAKEPYFQRVSQAPGHDQEGTRDIGETALVGCFEGLSGSRSP